MKCLGPLTSIWDASKGLSHTQIPLVPNVPSAVIIHSSTPPCPVPLALLRHRCQVQEHFLSTAHWRISILASTSRETQTRIDTIDLSCFFAHLFQISTLYFLGYLVPKVQRFYFFHSCLLLLQKILAAVLLQSGIQFAEYIYMC